MLKQAAIYVHTLNFFYILAFKMPIGLQTDQNFCTCVVTFLKVRQRAKIYVVFYLPCPLCVHIIPKGLEIDQNFCYKLGTCL